MSQSQIDFELPAQRHSQTSKAAAVNHAEVAKSMDALARRLFKNAGERGLTDSELRELMNGYESARPRRVGLLNRGIVIDSGLKRANAKGNLMVVWIWVGD